MERHKRKYGLCSPTGDGRVKWLADVSGEWISTPSYPFDSHLQALAAAFRLTGVAGGSYSVVSETHTPRTDATNVGR